VDYAQLNPRYAFVPLSVDMFAQPYFKLPLYALKLSESDRLLDAAGRLLPNVRGVWKRRWLHVYNGRMYIQRDMKVCWLLYSPPPRVHGPLNMSRTGTELTPITPTARLILQLPRLRIRR
jgi:hypothetical protein